MVNEMELEKEIIVELQDIRKEFPGVVALDHVNMKIRKGAIHALLGENGAGKSTLMKILSGTYQSYEGRIICRGEEIRLHSEKDAFDHGISIVSQELNYVPEMTIAENLFLGRAPIRNGIIVDRKKRAEDSAQLLSLMGLEYDPETLMKDLSVAQRQMVEILKAISRNASLVIMDEPTSALTSKETEILFNNIRRLRDQGISFVFITHRLEEVFRICDEYTVLRDGECIGAGALKDVTSDDLITMMVGRKIDDIYPEIPEPTQEVMLEVKDLTAEPRFHDVSFEIHKGEILGFAGMMGAGRSEIARAVFGMDQKDKGEILLDGKVQDFRNSRDAIRSGIVMVTEDRAAYGFVPVLSIKDNIRLPNADLFAEKGLWKKDRVNESVERICELLSVKAPDSDTLVQNLSGGNQQKVVLSKWLVRDVKVLILDEPTRGIDVGAKREIYHLISDLAQKGIAILLISSDLPEVLSMSHRIAVIANGSVAGILSQEEASQDRIMKMIVEAG